MDIEISEITEDNFIEAIRLKVKPDQENYVAYNAVSLAQSKFQPFLKCIGIFDGDVMVGFSAFGQNPEDGTIWIVRHMVGEQYQGQGYGKKGLQVLISHLQSTYQCDKIYLDVVPDNQVAINLYRSAGFVDTGKIQGHSRVFEKNLG